MRTTRGIRTLGRVGMLICLTVPLPAQAPPGWSVIAVRSARTDDRGDGQHDFDFNFGTWKTHVSRLEHPLSGSTTWVEYDGISHVGKVWDGRASLLELAVEGPAGRIEGAGLRLYNAETRQWSLNWVNSGDGAPQKPMIGGFEHGRGEFYVSEPFEGRLILVRNSFSNITPTSSRFEQAFSADGGRTWETNWVMTFTRAGDEASAGHRPAPAADVSHDFDWDFGAWKVQAKRLLNPLSDSASWTPLTGTVVVRKVLDGRANLAEVDFDGPSGRLEILALRVYNPTSRQWSLSFSRVGTGELGTPMFGEFKGGRGEFYSQDTFRGRAVLMRFTFSSLVPDAGRSEQAFSADGGKTWETNWINEYTRVRTPSTQEGKRHDN